MQPNFVLLYVENPTLSSRFYQDLFNLPSLENSENFSLLSVNESSKLGLWRRSTVLPSVTAATGAMELAIMLPDAASVQAKYEDWQNRGIHIAQTPVQMDFGFTFVGLDPDGHRLRVYALS
jgi:predicted enzyme related to lactoylglutathione lyase